MRSLSSGCSCSRCGLIVVFIENAPQRGQPGPQHLHGGPHQQTARFREVGCFGVGLNISSGLVGVNHPVHATPDLQTARSPG